MPAAIPDFLYPRFSDAEFERRHARARTLMSGEGLAALVVYGHSGMSRHMQADVLWLSGFFGNRNNYVAMVDGGAPVLFAQSHNHVPNAREMASIETRWGGADSAATIARFLLDAGTAPGVLGWVGDVPAADWLTWQKLLPGWTFREVTARMPGCSRRNSVQSSNRPVSPPVACRICATCPPAARTRLRPACPGRTSRSACCARATW